MHYIGGKSRLIRTLLPLIPNHRCYVEVFGGAAQLLFAKDPSPVEVYNDIDGHLVNLFLIVRDQPREFQERLMKLPYSRRLFNIYRVNMETGDPFENAVRFFYVARNSFSGEVGSGWRHGMIRSAAKDYSSTLSQLGLISKRLEKVQIENLDFRECIKTYDGPETLFFCDPPYYGVAAYKHSFSEKDHEDLAEILRRVKGKFLLTYNDHPHVRHLYAGFELMVKKLPVVTPLVKGGEKRRMWDQLVIANYPLPKIAPHCNVNRRPNRVRIPETRPPFRSEGPKIRGF